MVNLQLLKEKILITGCNGLLGQKLVETFVNDYEVLGSDIQKEPYITSDGFKYAPCDITQRKEAQDLIRSFEPNFIINAAAYTNVDGCEDDKEICWKVNVTGVENLGHAGRMLGAHFIHISSDYVFDGVEGNYSETSKPNPLGYYGRSKLASENVVVASGIDYTIIRTMVLYGCGRNVRLNFATWLVERLSKGESVTIVDDQFGQPTLADDLAEAIRKVVVLKKTGLYHIAGSEYIDRYHFALKLAQVFNFDSKLVKPIKTPELKQKAQRPLKSSFNIEKAIHELGIEMKGVEAGLMVLKQQLKTSTQQN